MDLEEFHNCCRKGTGHLQDNNHHKKFHGSKLQAVQVAAAEADITTLSAPRGRRNTKTTRKP